ncbi:MAG: DUF1294 domain-containing protein [Firmicutes bacterium]|nr:DUF1294 domain-containing protein [Bacillota bacterium]
MYYLGVFLILFNLFGFASMGYDKFKARHGGYRVREAYLLGMAFFGAAPGCYLGMRVFHHKTQHGAFKYGLPLLVFWNLGAALVLHYVISVNW